MIRDRFLVTAGLGLVTALSWAWIAPMAIDMYGPMTGLSAWMMTRDWTGLHLLLLWAMWAVMMAAMMLPTAAPVVMLYAQAERRREGEADVVSRAYTLAAGYLVVWALFSVAATILQRALSQSLLLNPMMELVEPTAIAVVLALAGLYQFTPIKRLCLQGCRSPLSFVMSRRPRGRRGALRLGLAHGVYCVGCCWALMLLLFAGGVMNLWVIVALSAIVLAEKLLPWGDWVSRIVGAALLVTAAWVLIR